MGLLWTFMGASMAYTIFAGSAEALAVLLFIPRLATLGGLAAMAVLTNVFMLNMCYDVPVKLYSFNLLMMAMFLVAPNVRRLVGLLVLRERVELHNLDGQAHPALMTDTPGWRRVLLEYDGYAALLPMSEPRQSFLCQVNAAKKTMTLGKRDNKNWKSALTFDDSKADTLLLKGE